MIQLSSKRENAARNMRRHLASTLVELLPICNPVRAAMVEWLLIDRASESPNKRMQMSRRLGRARWLHRTRRPSDPCRYVSEETCSDASALRATMMSSLPDHAPPQRRSLIRFSLRDMFALVVVVAVALGWWVDRHRLTKRIELREKQIWHLQQQPRGFSGAPDENRLSSVNEFLNLLRHADENEFMDKAGPFAATDLSIEALPGLVDVLRDPDAAVRAKSLQVLTWMGPRAAKAIPDVIALLDDESSSVRCLAMAMLADCGPASQDALPVLRTRMMDDRSPDAAFAAATVAKIEPSASVGERFCQLLSNGLAVNRWTAAQYIPDYVEPGVAKELLEARYDVEDDPTTRAMIAMSLNRLDESDTANVLIRHP